MQNNLLELKEEVEDMLNVMQIKARVKTKNISMIELNIIRENLNRIEKAYPDLCMLEINKLYNKLGYDILAYGYKHKEVVNETLF